MAPLTIDRIKELHEAARYAKAHGSGSVTLPADELLSLLPAEPVDVTPAIPPSAMQNETPHVFAEPSAADEPGAVDPAAKPVAAASPDPTAEQIAEEIHEKTGAQTEVVNGVPMVEVPLVSEPGPVLVETAAQPAAESKPAESSEPTRSKTEDGI